jgi:hypothetical protein
VDSDRRADRAVLRGRRARLLAESRAGNRFEQGWQFYAITFSLFIVFAFPGFTFQYRQTTLTAAAVACSFPGAAMAELPNHDAALTETCLDSGRFSTARSSSSSAIRCVCLTASRRRASTSSIRAR